MIPKVLYRRQKAFTLFGSTQANLANIIELPDGYRGIPEEMILQDTLGNYTILCDDGTVIKDVKITNIDLPSEDYLPLLFGGARIKINIDTNGKVYPHFIPGFEDRDRLRAAALHAEDKAARLDQEFRTPTGTPEFQLDQERLAEHFGETRVKTRRGRRRMRPVQHRGLPSTLFQRPEDEFREGDGEEGDYPPDEEENDSS